MNHCYQIHDTRGQIFRVEAQFKVDKQCAVPSPYHNFRSTLIYILKHYIFMQLFFKSYYICGFEVSDFHLCQDLRPPNARRNHKPPKILRPPAQVPGHAPRVRSQHRLTDDYISLRELSLPCRASFWFQISAQSDHPQCLRFDPLCRYEDQSC